MQIATVIAMTALANVGATYLLTLFGLDEWAGNTFAVTTVGVAILAAVTVIAYRGIELARTVQYALLGLQLVALAGFGVAAFIRPGAEAPEPELAQPVRLRRVRPVRGGRGAVPVHLLGLGRVDHRQRGNPRRATARPARPP